MFRKKQLITYLTGATLSASSGMAGSFVPTPIILFEASGEDVAEALSKYEDSDETAETSQSETSEQESDTTPFDVVEATLNRLSDDEISEHRSAVVKAIVSGFEKSGGITRTRVVSEWTISDSAEKRRIIAAVLSHDFYCLGAEGATRFLAADPVSRVRMEMVNTAVSRLREDPQHYETILQRLSLDSNRRVRRAARRALRDLTRHAA
jgi:hypothetical protein